MPLGPDKAPRYLQTLTHEQMAWVESQEGSRTAVVRSLVDAAMKASTSFELVEKVESQLREWLTASGHQAIGEGRDEHAEAYASVIAFLDALAERIRDERAA